MRESVVAVGFTACCLAVSFHFYVRLTLYKFRVLWTIMRVKKQKKKHYGSAHAKCASLPRGHVSD